MITLNKIIASADTSGKRWILLNEEKAISALKNLNELHWPAVVNPSEFKCSKFDTPIVARLFGYRARRCNEAADGQWRNKSGQVCAARLYELIHGGFDGSQR